jgi:hypothetical protein
MAQTTIAFARANTDRHVDTTEAAWTNPANVQSPDGTTSPDDNVDASGTATLLVPLGITDWAQFHLLAAEAGSVFSGLKIPVGASILGLRFHFEVNPASGTPTQFYRVRVGGATVTEQSTTATGRAVRTIGYGTLSAGSTHAMGNTFNGRDLSTEAGQSAARADLADGTLELGSRGSDSNAVTSSTIALDYAKVEVSWVLYANATGGAKATTTAADAGSTQLVTRSGGAKATTTAADAGSTQLVTRSGGAKATTIAGGSPHPLVTQPGGAKAAAATAGDAGSTQLVTQAGGAKATASAAAIGSTQLITPTGGAKATTKAGGSPKVQVSRGASGAYATATAGGSPHPLVTQAGGANAATAGSDEGSTQLVTASGGAKATTKAGAGETTVVSYAIAGYARDRATDAIITTGIRVDVYRTSNHQHMGRVTTGADGRYAVAIPHTGNETETFWVRFKQTGSPDRFATGREDLTLISTVVQAA